MNEQLICRCIHWSKEHGCCSRRADLPKANITPPMPAVKPPKQEVTLKVVICSAQSQSNKDALWVSSLCECAWCITLNSEKLSNYLHNKEKELNEVKSACSAYMLEVKKLKEQNANRGLEADKSYNKLIELGQKLEWSNLEIKRLTELTINKSQENEKLKAENEAICKNIEFFRKQFEAEYHAKCILQIRNDQLKKQLDQNKCTACNSENILKFRLGDRVAVHREGRDTFRGTIFNMHHNKIYVIEDGFYSAHSDNPFLPSECRKLKRVKKKLLPPLENEYKSEDNLMSCLKCSENAFCVDCLNANKSKLKA